MTDGEPTSGNLSNREHEVARAYADGDSYKEIARELGVSPTTVRSHLRTVYGKLGVTSKIELARFLSDDAKPEPSRESAEMVAELALELDEAVRRERSLAKVLRIISDQSGELDAVIDSVLDHALEICEAEFGILFEYEGDLQFRELRSRNIPPAFAQWLSDKQVFPVEPGTGLGRVASQLQAVNVADVRSEDIYESRSPLRVATADLGKARSFAAIPMVSGNRLIGAFTVYRTRVHPFNERSLELAQLFADQAVIAIENVRQFEQLQVRLERESVNREILQLISQSLEDEVPVFDLILKNAAELCGADAAALTLGRKGDPHQRLAASRGVHAATKAHYDAGRVSMNPTSFAAKAILSGEPVYVEDFAQTDGYRQGDPAMRSLVDDTGMRTSLFVPLLSKAGGIGALVLFRREVRPYTTDEIALVESFATQAVIAIENVRQFRELQARLERESVNREILQVISQSREDEAPVFDYILKSARRLCDAPFAALVLGRKGEDHQTMVAHHGAVENTVEMYRDGHVPMDPEKSFAARAILEKRAVHLPNMQDTDEYRAGILNVRTLCDIQGIRTNLFVPLIANGEGIGCFIIFRHEVRPYTDDQIALVEIFAAQAVIAIENVRQFRALQARLEREAVNREILQVISQNRDDEQPVFEAIIDNAQRLCEAKMAAFVMGEEGGGPQVMVAHRGATEETLRIYREGHFPMDPQVSTAARAIVEQRTIHLHDMAATDLYRQRHPNFVSLVENQGIRTNLLVPLISARGGIGCLILFRDEVRPYTDDQIALVETFAAQAVIAIDNVRQFKALENLNAHLSERVQEQVGQIERMDRLKQFLSPAVADALVMSGDEVMLQSHRALIATLFCDIRGFTAFCETAEPEETIEVLQAYHQEMGNLISAHGGGVDKRMGDGIMVIFNDPLPCTDPAGDAVRLAIAMRDRMKELCRGWKRLGHRLGFGVGVSLGYATIGMVGSEGRYDYTASGTSVNLAARLCDRAEDGEILLSPRAVTAVEDDFKAESSGEITLKGIREPVEVFRLVDPLG